MKKANESGGNGSNDGQNNQRRKLRSKRATFYSRRVNYTPEIEAKIAEILDSANFDWTYLQHAAHTCFNASAQDVPPCEGTGWLWEMGRQFISSSWNPGDAESGLVNPVRPGLNVWLNNAGGRIFGAVDEARMASEKAAALMLAASDALAEAARDDHDLFLSLSANGLRMLTNEAAFALIKANEKAMDALRREAAAGGQGGAR